MVFFGLTFKDEGVGGGQDKRQLNDKQTYQYTPPGWR